jgi:hypothetical protein
MVVIRSSAGAVLATVATQDAFAVLRAAADAVGVSTVAYDPTVISSGTVTAAAGIALAAVTAFDPSGQGNRQDALADLVNATASAHAATVSHVSPPPRARVYRV